MSGLVESVEWLLPVHRTVFTRAGFSTNLLVTDVAAVRGHLDVLFDFLFVAGAPAYRRGVQCSRFFKVLYTLNSIFMSSVLVLIFSLFI